MWIFMDFRIMFVGVSECNMGDVVRKWWFVDSRKYGKVSNTNWKSSSIRDRGNPVLNQPEIYTQWRCRFWTQLTWGVGDFSSPQRIQNLVIFDSEATGFSAFPTGFSSTGWNPSIWCGVSELCICWSIVALGVLIFYDFLKFIHYSTFVVSAWCFSICEFRRSNLDDDPSWSKCW